MKKIIHHICCGLMGLLLCVCSESQAEEASPAYAEDLLFMELPTVITPSRKLQKVSEAPSAITVITAEEIKAYGARSIVDVLRLVAGIDVATVSSRDQWVSIHGFNEAFTSNILVLKDGRTVNWPVYNMVFWELVSHIDEVEQIEIVKGPGSSLYGANAFGGVINIITKSPQKINGAQASVLVGDPRMAAGSVLVGKNGSRINYKVASFWDTQDDWKNSHKEDAGSTLKTEGFLEYAYNETRKLSFIGGQGKLYQNKVYASPAYGLSLLDGTENYAQIIFTDGNFRYKTYINMSQYMISFVSFPSWDSHNTVSLEHELLHYFQWADAHNILWGADYQHIAVDRSPVFIKNHTQDIGAFFAEDQIDMHDALRCTLGARLDRHPLSGTHISPRASLVYDVSSRHTFRVSAAQAYRNPGLFNSYVYTESVVTVPSLPAITYKNVGNKDLQAEDVTSYEVECKSQWGQRVHSGLNFFFVQYKNFIQWSKTNTYYALNEAFPGSPADTYLKESVYTFENAGKANGVGVDFTLDFLITRALTGMFNYSYSEIQDGQDKPATSIINEENHVREMYPRNKLNAGLIIRSHRGFLASALVRWVDTTTVFLTDEFENEYVRMLDGYAVVNTNVSLPVWDGRGEIALGVSNILDNRHYESHPGVNVSVPMGEEIGRRITLKTTYRF